MKRHGINWGYGPIPEEIRKLFRQELPNKKGRLQGVTDDHEELLCMLAIANNGRRQLTVVERKPYFAIYTW